MSGGDVRAARKELARLERRTDKLRGQETDLHSALADVATDHERVRDLSEQLRVVEAEREALEEQWLDLAATIE